MKSEATIPPRILMFAPSCYPPGNPEAFVNANLVLAFLDAGWEIDVVSRSGLDQWYPSDLDPWRAVASRTTTVAEIPRTLASRLLGGVKVPLVSGQLAPGARWAYPAAREGLRLAARKRYDFILSRVLPSDAHLAAFIVARKSGIPWIANWNDPSPWEKFPPPYAGGRGSGAGLGFWGTRYYRAVARTAAWHTFPCERLRDYVAGYLPGGIGGKSSVIPHVALEKGSEASPLNASFTLLHAGSLRAPRSCESYLRGVRIFLERVRPKSGVSVVFIVDRPDEVLAAARKSGVEAVVRIEKGRPYTEMPAALAGADVLVIIEAPVAEGIFLPSKFVDYVRSRRPILAVSPAVGTLADLIGRHGGGVAADVNRPEQIASAIAGLYQQWKQGTLDERFGSAGLYPIFSPETVLGAYGEIFSRISCQTKGRRHD